MYQKVPLPLFYLLLLINKPKTRHTRRDTSREDMLHVLHKLIEIFERFFLRQISLVQIRNFLLLL